MHEIRDNQLLNLIKAGDKSAFSLVVEEYQELLFMEAHRKLKNDAAAQDAVQEIFIWLWLKKDSIEIHSSLRNYLFGAVRNYCLNVIRTHNTTQKRKLHYAYIRDAFVYSNELENKELNCQLKNAINNISPASRTAFEMQYIEGFSQKEIAIRRGVGLQTVKNQVLTALKELRISLSKV